MVFYSPKLPIFVNDTKEWKYLSLFYRIFVNLKIIMETKTCIPVTSPLLPGLDEFTESLKQIWDCKWITNYGPFHKQLEEALCEYLKVPYISLFTNGTLPLIAALKVLDIKGEVITTPYSFVATSHSIMWSDIKPVFVDVDPITGNMDPARIEEAITPRTAAIMPVHVYGQPCDAGRIQGIADKYGLKVIYDAAHCFGVEVNGESILNAGDISTISFHATKVFNTIEGGAMIMKSRAMKEKVDRMSDFGFTGEIDIEGLGINAKLDEVRSAYGLLNLKKVDEAIEARHKIAEAYREALKGVPGIRFLEDMPGVRHNYGYFPIFVDSDEYGMTRDELYAKLKDSGIYARRYFYPLISSIGAYKDIPSASPENLPNANKLAEQVICLPVWKDISAESVLRTLKMIHDSD